MKRTDKTDGSYILTADAGKDLAIQDADGVTSRTKEVIISAAGTLNTWIEVDELPPETVSDEDTAKAAKIAELEAELARLKAE